MRETKFNIGDLVSYELEILAPDIGGFKTVIGIITNYSYRYTKDEDTYMLLSEGRQFYVRAHQLKLISKANKNNE